MLATTFPSPALGQNYPVEAVAPTAQEIQNWGFTVEEFQGLVQRMFDLLKKQYQLSQELGTPWITKMDDAALRREAVGNVEQELSLRRRYPSTPLERFRQGMHRRALEGAAQELFSGLERDIAGMQQKLDTLQANRTRIRQRVPQSEVYEPSPHDTRVRGVTPEGSNPENMEVVELNRLGNVPAEEQAARFQAQTVRETPPDVRESVQPNPNYQGPPAMDDPNMRGTVKPLAPSKPSAILRYGPSVLIVLDNLRAIQDCHDQGVAAVDCLKNIMVRNGIAVSLAAATELIAAVPTVQLVIAGVTTYYSASNIYDALDNVQAYRQARDEAEKAEKNRADWLRQNMAIRDMPAYVAQLRQRIDDTLGPLDADMEAQCADLWQMASAAAPAADSVASAMREMPEKSALLTMEPMYDRAMDALADERVLRRDLEDLRQAFAALDGDEARIAAFRQSAEGLAERARTHMAMEDELAAAKGTLDKAFSLMARIRNLSAGAVPFERLEALDQRIQQTRSSRAGQADRLRIEIQSLKRAFPGKEITPDMKANLLTLDAEIDKHLRTDCNTADMIATHRAGAGSATDRLLDVQNRLEPVDLLHASLSRLDYGTGREVLAAVQDMLGRLQPPATDDQPATATGGFQDEGGSVRPGDRDRAPPEQTRLADSGFTSEGGDVRERHDGDQEPTAQAEHGGFVDEGTVVGTGDVDLLDTPTSHAPQPPAQQPSPPARQPPAETVTYFDRPWLPRSWQTSGDAKQTRAEVYQAASRLGWAAALAEFAPATADNLIVDHLNATAGHLQRANQASFAPHKAWPDWQHRKEVYGQWIRRLTQASTASREYFRKGLDSLIRTEARSLREQLLTQTPRQAGGLSNCDSTLFQIGYDLAYAAQVQSIALDGMNAGKDKAWARQLMNKASGSATSAGRNIQLIKPTPQRKGCPDYTVLSQELNQAKSRLNTAAQPELHAVWSKGLALAAGGGASYDPDDLAGEWLIASDMSLSWGNYIKRKPDTLIDVHNSSSVRVRFDKRGSDYVGTITRQGMVPTESDAWTYESTGHNRVQVFRIGLEYLHMRKIGKNLFQGTILGVGTPGDNNLRANPIYIAVYDEAAKLLQQLSNMPSEVFTKENGQGKLMLRLAAAPASATPNMEAVGRHVFAGMDAEAPRGSRLIQQSPEHRKLGSITGPAYGIKYQKPFQFRVSTDNNPGLYAHLHYLGNSKPQDMDQGLCGKNAVHQQHFDRHGGRGFICMFITQDLRHPKESSLSSWLVWHGGEWGVSIYLMDYPQQPGTMFGGTQGQINYMIHLLDRWAPRLKTIPPGAMEPTDASAPSAQPASQPHSGGTSLLGIEAR